ncbi:hypothetical protein BDP81DRAFT_158004 [Colletotrichum phormii]|uniref:Uncharacterized protein n=1 Tax=Colletotrichum phormii TaxID=359342 RepID=A0AAJ0EIK7_9PEZI|nr:uncharacterized protein BDP81DRAFT_158004 [Colletotrichum phormii]KAK1640074.1 hypothetical protein BDP81DRAFT_158004 [Colletotrichum phormii]
MEHYDLLRGRKRKYLDRSDSKRGTSNSWLPATTNLRLTNHPSIPTDHFLTSCTPGPGKARPIALPHDDNLPSRPSTLPVRASAFPPPALAHCRRPGKMRDRVQLPILCPPKTDSARLQNAPRRHSFLGTTVPPRRDTFFHCRKNYPCFGSSRVSDIVPLHFQELACPPSGANTSSHLESRVPTTSLHMP